MRVGFYCYWEIKLYNRLRRGFKKSEKQEMETRKSGMNWWEKASFQKTNFTLMEKVFNIRTQSVVENVEELIFKNSLGSNILFSPCWTSTEMNNWLNLFIFTRTHRENYGIIYMYVCGKIAMCMLAISKLRFNNTTCLTHL